jgi:hypothetical protein
MKRRLLVMALAAVSFGGPAMAGREDQWVLRTELGDGAFNETAIFLSWDFSAVLFRLQCDQDRHEVVLTYFGDEVSVAVDAPQLTIEGGHVAAPMRTTLTPFGLEARLSPSEPGYSVYRTPTDLTIIAPNAMNEPWYVGRAEPLRRVMQACASGGNDR